MDELDHLGEAEEQSQELGLTWVSLLVPTHRLDIVNSALRSGYEMVDVRLTLRLAGPIPATDRVFSLATADDSAELSKIATSAFGLSRFFVDKHLDDHLCARFYERWVENSFNGQMADAVVVTKTNGDMDGFISLRCAMGGPGSLPLVAVRTDRRKQGVAAGLLACSLSWMKSRDAKSIEVVTQASNISAVRLYESAGFKIVDTSIWLHRWAETG